MKTSVKDKAIKLRLQGYLYSEISVQLGVPKSTVYGWTKHCKLSNHALQLQQNKLVEAKSSQTLKMTRARQQKLKELDAVLLSQARLIVGKLDTSKAQSALICALLIWCEGQTDTSSGVRFMNSDPKLVALFMRHFRASFQLDESKFRALLHLHDYHDEPAQIELWSHITSIPAVQFHKSYIKPHTGKTKRIDYPGCISIRYSDARLGKTLKMIYSELW